MLQVLLADSQAIVRAGIKALLKQQLPAAVVEEASDASSLTCLLKHQLFHLVIMDINLPGMDFSNTLPWIVQVSPETRILIFTGSNEEIYGLRCMRLGAEGFLHKSAVEQEIITAINRLVAGRKYISSKLAEHIAVHAVWGEAGSPFERLSARELEIAMLMARGLSLPAISRQLNIQYSTCNTYKRRIFEKLGVQDLVALAHLMQAYGISEE